MSMLRTVTLATPVPLLAPWLLVITLLQGTSFTLSLAVRLDTSGALATLVSVVWLASYAVALLLLLTRAGPDWIGWCLRYRLPLFMLMGGVLASTAWSIAPALTLERSVHFIGSTLVALALGFTLPLPRMLSISTVVFALLIMLSVVAALWLPAIGIEDYEGLPVWRGVMASKNTLGFWAAIATLLFTSRACATGSLAVRAGLVLMSALSLLCLAMSLSATSLLALLVAALMMLYAHATRSLSLGAVASGALGLMVLLLVSLAVSSIETAELIGRSGDLTGRGELWSQVWQLIQQRPWTGYGYGTLWYPTNSSLWIQQSLLDLGWTTYHAHNGLLQIASGVGIPMAVLAVLFALQQLIEIIYAHYRAQPEGALFVLGFAVALLVSNYAEARLLVNRELYWIWFVALPLSLVRLIQVVPAVQPQLAGWQRSVGRAIRPLAPAVRHGLVRRRHQRTVRTAVKQRLLPRTVPRPETGAEAAGTQPWPKNASADSSVASATGKPDRHRTRIDRTTDTHDPDSAD